MQPFDGIQITVERVDISVVSGSCSVTEVAWCAVKGISRSRVVWWCELECKNGTSSWLVNANCDFLNCALQWWLTYVVDFVDFR